MRSPASSDEDYAKTELKVKTCCWPEPFELQGEKMNMSMYRVAFPFIHCFSSNLEAIEEGGRGLVIIIT